MNDFSSILPTFDPGSVWLVGAGPGDPGLLSLLGYHGLRHADVVVYDALVDQAILDLARADIDMVYAGKRGGKPSTDQADISTALIDLARSGKRVMRLKGGDPFVFGRGPQECMALAEADIPFRIVPGISSGIGGLAYAGIPVTSRETNTAVSFITGHTAAGDLPHDVDWVSLAKASPVIVIYMGARHLDNIVDKLISAGRNGDEPIAFISRATTPDQKLIISKLASAVVDFQNSGLETPVLIVVGKVVNYHHALAWFDPQ